MFWGFATKFRYISIPLLDLQLQKKEKNMWITKKIQKKITSVAIAAWCRENRTEVWGNHSAKFQINIYYDL